MQLSRHFSLRPAEQTVLDLPFSIRSAGQYAIAPDTPVNQPARKDFFQFFWVSHGSGSFRIGREERTLHPGECFYYKPGEIHSLVAGPDGWKYGWFTLRSQLSQKVFQSIPLPGRTWKSGVYPTDLFTPLVQAVADPSPAGEREASIFAYRILVAALGQQSGAASPPSIAEKTRRALLRNHESPDYGVDHVAQELRVHRTTIFRFFKRAYAQSPAEYLRNLRLQRALELLKDTSLPVAEVAGRSGFSDANYFARSIRQSQGLSPRELRQQSLVNGLLAKSSQ